jgi:hypothetical protein
MGAILILLGLVSAGVFVDYVIENVPSPNSSIELLGSSFTVTQTEVAAAAFVAGAVAVVFLFLGLRLMRASWGRRRSTKRRLTDLERENAQLRTKSKVTSSPQASGGG